MDSGRGKKRESITIPFTAHPEAWAMPWGTLFSPLQLALRDVLYHLDEATKGDREVPAGCSGSAAEPPGINCFLLYGKRGTGKTTVLLSAQQAVSNPGQVFSSEQGRTTLGANQAEEDRAQTQALKHAESLQRKCVWLDILDLEGMPPDTNFLTAILVRLQTKLDEHGDGGSPATAYYEEGEQGARQQIRKLLADSALAWERKVADSDARTLASHDMRRQEIHQNFKRRFTSAVTALRYELGTVSGGRSHHIVLPIDNIDRSPEHLDGIIKLAHMVSCPGLWLLMAGDRGDIHTFLERIYWKQLIQVGQAAGPEKKGPGGEDEALLLARRQAAASAHKVFPPSHRIKVGLVPPEQVLAFKPSKSSRDGYIRAQPSLAEILESIKKEPHSDIDHDESPPHAVAVQQSRVDFESTTYTHDRYSHTELSLGASNIETERSQASSVARQWHGPRVSLLDFFIPEQHRNTGQPEDWRADHFTELAALCLYLPARGVHDIWRLAHRTSDEHTQYQLEDFSRRALKEAIHESNVAPRQERELETLIHERGHRRDLVIDVSPPYPRLCHFYLRTELANKRFVQNDFPFRQRLAITLSITRPTKSFLALVPQGKERSADDDLPSDITGWLMLLHDSVLWSRDSALVIKHEDLEQTFTFASLSYSSREAEHKVRWTVVAWRAYYGRELFCMTWRWLSQYWRSEYTALGRMLIDSADAQGSTGPTRNACGRQLDTLNELFIREMAAAWLYTTLKTSVAVAPRLQFGAEMEEWDHEPNREVKLFAPELAPYMKPLNSLRKRTGSAEKAPADMSATELLDQLRREVGEREKWVARQAEQIYTILCHQERNAIYRSIHNWMERYLPLMLSYLYVPVTRSVPHTDDSSVDLTAYYKSAAPTLYEVWQHNSDFILHDLDEELKKLFPKSRPPSEFLNLHKFLDRYALGSNCDRPTGPG